MIRALNRVPELDRILKDTSHVFNPFVRNFDNLGSQPAKFLPGSRFSLWIKAVLIASLIATFPLFPDSAEAETKYIKKSGLYENFQAEGDIRRFEGEQLLFDISFMVFENAATADVRFFEEKGRYYSILKAETKGFVGFVTSHRKHYYKASFDISKDGRRVLTRKFEREVINGNDIEKTTHYLDYKNRKHFWFKYNNNELTEQQTEVIPEGKFYDDILASFYNFRNGAYGPLKKGNRYKIDTIPDKSMKNISVHILPEKEQEKIRTEQGRPKADEYLLNVVIPKEIFKTDTGELLFWGSKHFIPLETKVLNYVLLGDLHVKLKKRLAR